MIGDNTSINASMHPAVYGRKKVKVIILKRIEFILCIAKYVCINLLQLRITLLFLSKVDFSFPVVPKKMSLYLANQLPKFF